MKEGQVSATEKLADAIIRIGDAVKRLKDGSGLNRRAIVALLHDSSGVGKRDIEFILDHLEGLQRNYCK